jgi:hypothetical protein
LRMGYRGNPGFTEVGVESPCLRGTIGDIPF